MGGLSDTEKEFLTMAKMAGMNVDEWVARELEVYGHPTIVRSNKPKWISGEIGSRVIDAPMMVAQVIARHRVQNEGFHIVSSSFLKLVEERPELRIHYDWAKEYWEGRQ